MGNWSGRSSQPKEIRTIYVRNKKESECYTLTWSESYAQLILDIRELFPMRRLLEGERVKLYVIDCTETCVCVCSESTFEAIVPKYRPISPTVSLYYCVLDRWEITKN